MGSLLMLPLTEPKSDRRIDESEMNIEKKHSDQSRDK